MMDRVAELGHFGMLMLRQYGKAGILLFRVVFHPPAIRKGIPLVIQQIYAEGVLSLLIIIVSGLFIGMVVALQGYHTLAKFGASQELGPVDYGAVLSPCPCSRLFLMRSPFMALIWSALNGWGLMLERFGLICNPLSTFT